jgi:lipopolysaccharide transport system ATP-binding protein
MSDIVLEIDNISKLYRLGTVGTGTLSHDLRRWWHTARGKEDPYLKIGEENTRDTKGDSEYIWALKGVSFEVKRGEVLGIIGKNGAGKSTLLKILSRITTPTTGEYKIKGRVASLLEVGTGFHGELTGRENIFLNGAILGMTKNEIKKKFDQIVAFSGIERYIDTPVKRYSSGMTVRLAFAVAAHLEPEILIIDEVLAVGDAEFQKKCLGKMKDVAGEGRTILFVSHNMTAVKSLCSKSIHLLNGEITFIGDTVEAISRYIGNSNNSSNQSITFNSGDFKNKSIELNSIDLLSKNADPAIITMSDEFSVSIKLNKKQEQQLDITIHVTDAEGNVLLITSSGLSNVNYDNKEESGALNFICNFPANFFNEGEYNLNILFVENKKKIIEDLKGILPLSILPANVKLGYWMGKSKGFFRLTTNKWEVINA